MRWPWARRVLTRRELGALGERHAARLLRAKGLQLLEGNYRTHFGELDLIAREENTLVFVEVRTRSAEDAFTPLASVDKDKQQRVLRLAHHYRRARRLPECYIRFDVVEVIATPTGEVREVRHYPGIFT